MADVAEGDDIGEFNEISDGDLGEFKVGDAIFFRDEHTFISNCSNIIFILSIRISLLAEPMFPEIAEWKSNVAGSTIPFPVSEPCVDERDGDAGEDGDRTISERFDISYVSQGLWSSERGDNKSSFSLTLRFLFVEEDVEGEPKWSFVWPFSYGGFPSWAV